MAKFQVEWLETKNADWRMATLSEGGQQITEVSINRKNKKGEIFPNFDGITLGATIEGELWRSPAGKAYLFAPREGTPRASGTGIKAAQERKAVMIEKAQDRKSESIAYFNANNCAIELVSKLDIKAMTQQDLEEEIIHWRDWFLSEYRKYEATDATDKKNPW